MSHVSTTAVFDSTEADSPPKDLDDRIERLPRQHAECWWKNQQEQAKQVLPEPDRLFQVLLSSLDLLLLVSSVVEEIVRQMTLSEKPFAIV